MNEKLAAPLGILLLAAVAVWSAATSRRVSLPPEGGWGIDACLSCHVPEEAAVGDYLALLKTSRIIWLRERDIGGPSARNTAVPDPNSREIRLKVWRRLKAEGFRVLAFASLPGNVAVEQEGNQLPEDLLAVFKDSRHLARLARGAVDAWEMNGEPEMFAKDLPDRLAAYEKAVYLGLKAGGGARAGAPAVLMGALVYPPGPWIDLAAGNGLYDYTDAINLHHYSFAETLGSTIEAQRQIALERGRSLPVWITEAGLNNVPYADFGNEAARRAQAEYIVDCARQAAGQNVAVFMPFILVHRGDPFAMTTDAKSPLPSWNAYRDFTLSHSLAGQAAPFAPPAAPNPLVLQWMPDNLTCTPDKISSSYWFDNFDETGWSPIEGEIRAYNFGPVPMRARLRREDATDASRLQVTMKPGTDGAIEIPPLGSVRWSVTLALRDEAYFRNTLRYVAETLDNGGKIVASSPLVFAVETPPGPDLPHAQFAIELAAPESKFAYIGGAAPFDVTGRSPRWLGINGVRVEAGDDTSFVVTDRNKDPLSPPMAIARLPSGLPPVKNGFLMLKARSGAGKPATVRVDLIDRDGQRFTISENAGRHPSMGRTDTVLLAYRDFHPWFFGNCVPGMRFDPARMRELQLRFYDAASPSLFRIDVNVVSFADRPPFADATIHEHADSWN